MSGFSYFCGYFCCSRIFRNHEQEWQLGNMLIINVIIGRRLGWRLGAWALECGRSHRLLHSSSKRKTTYSTDENRVRRIHAASTRPTLAAANRCTGKKYICTEKILIFSSELKMFLKIKRTFLRWKYFHCAWTMLNWRYLPCMFLYLNN